MVLASYYELLKEYIGFKTIQDTTQFTSEAEKTIKWLSQLLRKYNFEIQEQNIDNTPILTAKYIQNKNLPTGLIYTNYDLELLEISQERKNNPFNLYLGKDEIIGRGVAENKGQFIIYLSSIFKLIEEEKLGYNIIFLIDGTQNKIWSNINEYLKKSGLQADFCIFWFWSGVEQHATIEIGQRGTINFDIAFSREEEIHINPTLEISKMLNKLYNVNNKIAIPYFYYNVEKAKQEIEIKRYGTNLEYKTITKSIAKNHCILEPTLDITWIISFPKFEKSQSIPKKTIANLHMKIVNNQNYPEIINGLQQWLRYNIPQNLKTELIIHEARNPCKFNIQHTFAQKSIALLAGARGTSVEKKQNPIGLKVAETIQTEICPNIISLPFADEGSNIATANEHLKADTVKKIFDFCMAFFSK